MPIQYPEAPAPAAADIREGAMKPGEGVNARPLEASELLDFTTKVGKCSGVFYGIVFHLPKIGFDRHKIEEAIEVSPVFQQYYQLTIQQKAQLEAQIKQGLASIATAVSDLELVDHDKRKYQEFIDYFTMIDKGKEMLKEKKKEGEELVKRGDQSLRAIFVDEVDSHTDLPNTPIALRSIVTRWPTVIAEFMKLTDEDIDPTKIHVKYNVSEAEGVILATKNRLYVEWKDRLFRPTVEQRYKRLVGLVQARKRSVKEYKNMLRPIIARHKAINEMASNPKALQSLAMWNPGAQAISMDHVTLWAWRPFAPSEKYKVTREFMATVPLEEVGFRKDEIEYIKKKVKDDPSLMDKYFLGKEAKEIESLPVEPSIDNVVRRLAKKVEAQYGVIFNPLDFFDAREMLLVNYRRSITGLRREIIGGVGAGETWPFSPYFTFLEIPMDRTVIRLPNGEEVEDLWIENMKGFTESQNIILVRCLEIIARDKQLDYYISSMLGEAGVVEHEGKEIPKESIEEIIEAEKWKTEEEQKKETEKMKEETEKLKKRYEATVTGFQKVRSVIAKFFGFFGLDLTFFRSYGPYEAIMYERMTKTYQPETGRTFMAIGNWFKAAFGVPGLAD